MMTSEEEVRRIFPEASSVIILAKLACIESKSNFTLNCIPLNPCRKVVRQRMQFPKKFPLKIFGISRVFSLTSKGSLNVNYAKSFIVEV
jgi:hypothetical protein